MEKIYNLLGGILKMKRLNENINKCGDSSDGTSSSDSEDDFETPPSSPSNHRIRKEPDRRHQDWRLQLSHTFDWMEKRLVAEPRRPGNLTKAAFVPPTDCSQGSVAMVGDEVRFLVSVTNMGCEEWGPEVRMMEVGRSGPVTNTSSIGLCGLRPGEETLVEVKLEASFLPGFTESTWNIFDGDTSERFGPPLTFCVWVEQGGPATVGVTQLMEIQGKRSGRLGSFCRM